MRSETSFVNRDKVAHHPAQCILLSTTLRPHLRKRILGIAIDDAAPGDGDVAAMVGSDKARIIIQLSPLADSQFRREVIKGIVAENKFTTLRDA